MAAQDSHRWRSWTSFWPGFGVPASPGISTISVTCTDAWFFWQIWQFIEVAEKTGLIEELGAWVLRRACCQMAAWRRAGNAPPRIAVNLSIRQFRQPTLIDTIVAALEDTGLEAGALEIEVTESAVMTGAAEAAATLGRIKDLGISIAIDDFGTGYSSLYQLQRLRADYIKIDLSFVCGIPAQADDVRIADAIMAIAHTIGVKLIAEGIETPEQLEYLRRAGCEEGQGYLFSRPISAAEVASMLGADRLPHPRAVLRRLAPYSAGNAPPRTPDRPVPAVSIGE